MALTKIKNGKKVCTRCKELLPASSFGQMKDEHTSKKTSKITVRYYLNARCRECARQTTKEWMYKNRERMFLVTWKWREELKTKVYQHYGNQCACCGEDDYLFLTLDHINNDGYKDRKRKIGTHQYKDIIERNYPKDLQLLCWNCNCGKQRNFGVCPHQQIIEPRYGSRSRYK